MNRKLEILLLEDSEADAYLLKKILDRQFEYDLVHVISKEEFRTALTDQTFDVILADYNLPQFNGKEALIIRQQLEVDIPLIIFSGSLSPMQQVECLELNASDVIDKADINRIPYVIRRCIAEHMDRKKLNEVLEELQQSVHEKEILVSEIHHRVKNNLAVISGLLELSKFQDSVDDTVRKIFDDNIMRIKSISLVHETLYQDNQMTHVGIARFVKDLLHQTRNFYVYSRPNVQITDQIQDVKININQAVPLGLIITELVTNAMKHAFPLGEKGVITVNLEVKNQQVLLVVKDNGIGFPEHVDFNSMTSFGSMLVNQLVLQIDGTLQVISEPGGGLEFAINFKLSEKKGSSSAMKKGIQLRQKD
ncbi:MAG: ATP-binding protein, partial [Balneolales bacterium]|nr:ATP-binding protein [Balneolales bacterium]